MQEQCSAVLPCDPAAAPTARRILRDHLEALRCRADAIALAELITSELVSNAVQACRAAVRLDVRLDAEAQQLHIEVYDDGPGTPEPRNPGLNEPSGRGLQIVSALATSWGCRPDPSQQGKTVWFRLAVSG